jgi:hypothetical protein
VRGHPFKNLRDSQSGGDGRPRGGEDGVHFGLREGQETLHNDRIELRAAALNEAADSFFMRKAFAVGAGRDHGVEGRR